MLSRPSIQSRRRTGRRYVILLLVIFAAVGGWTALWKYAAARAQDATAEWRAREAAAGRVFTCGRETVGGYPFRLEVTCAQVRVQLRDVQPPLEINLPRVLTVAQVYQPNLLIAEFQGPLQLGEGGKPVEFEASWSLGQASVSGVLTTPDRVSLVFDGPKATRIGGGQLGNLFNATHLEVHGRPAQDSGKPGIEIGIRLQQGLVSPWRATAAQPVDAVIDAVLRGVTDISPKPWSVRLREMQATGGGLEIKQARVAQGDILAIGSGALTFNAAGRLDGQLRVTIAGLEAFLDEIGAKQMVQTSPTVDKLAGALDRLAPGLGAAAKQQMSENIGTGINAIGEPATLEGRNAVTVPLRFDEGAVFLGPVPLGVIPAGY
jgi:hypothetical protein